MATYSSDLVTDRNARPPVFSSPGLTRGQGRRSKAVVTPGVALVTNDIVLLVTVKTDDIISAINFKNTDMDTGATGTTDLGLYSIADTPVAVDIDAYAAASTFLRAANADWSNQDITRTAAVQGQAVWEDVAPALTSDPKTEYYLALTVQADFDTAGTIAVEVEFNDLNS